MKTIVSIAIICLLPTLVIGRPSLPSDSTEAIQDIPRDWVDQLQNNNGNVCCFDNDGRRLEDPDWRVQRIEEDNVYFVAFTEGWIRVPTWALVQQRNKDGIARVWSVVDTDSGERTIRCFLPGSLS